MTYGANLVEQQIYHPGRMELEQDGVEDHAESVVEVTLIE
jgi:hypothetical protein